MPILDTISGWQIEKGDFIILDGEHVEILNVHDEEDDGVIYIDLYSHDNGDRDERIPLLVDARYDIWGE